MNITDIFKYEPQLTGYTHMESVYLSGCYINLLTVEYSKLLNKEFGK